MMWTKNAGMSMPRGIMSTLVLAASVLALAGIARAQCETQTARLVGTGGAGTSTFQGQSIALSADGNTVIVGASGDNGSVGAAYIFTRSGTSWTQLGTKIVPAGGVGSGVFGHSVAMSADGNTALVGASGDNGSTGAVYVLVREGGGAWVQQGLKLLPSGEEGNGAFGTSVALSADGYTAIIGASQDHSQIGAAYIFTRSGTAWSQLGDKLLPADGDGASEFGTAVSMSADGQTVAIGAYDDNEGIGAVHVFVQSGSGWSQQGPKLVPVGGVGAGIFGSSVSMSADGNTILIGASDDNDSVGAAYVFARSGGVWSQSGPRLVPTGGVGNGQFGHGIALSGDGGTALIGANVDNSGLGAAYIFVHASEGGGWVQQGAKLVATGGVGTHLVFGQSAALSANGRIAAIGAFGDGNFAGAAYIFNRACPADFDCSGGVAVQDIFEYLNAWFADDPRADFDGVSGIQVLDIFAFLNAWFAGCS